MTKEDVTGSPEFNVLIHQYAMCLLAINNFIEHHGLDYDKTWDKANQHYDKLMEGFNDAARGQ